MNTITLGRRPTLGEVIDYYSQERFLHYLLDTTRRRRVVLVISKKMHWEPNWAKDEVVGSSTDDLRRFILRKIEWYLPGIGTDERPEFYPAFHQSVWKGTGGDGENGRQQDMDCVFEADLPTWHDAFQDVGTVIPLFERYGVPYQHKFSGHRSLHIVIPGEAIPPGYRGKGTRKLAAELLQGSSSQAHHLPKITRMPYGLNEDTGLVCLPIEPGELSSFRPWQANLHLVDVPEASWSPEIHEGDRERLAELMDDLAAEAREASSRTAAHARPAFIIERLTTIPDRYRDRLGGLESSDTVGRAWARLAGDAPVTTVDLLQGLSQADPDAVWLWTEAYIFHGTRMTTEVFEALIEQSEEYAQAAATDALLRFEKAIVPLIAEAIRNLSIYTSRGARAAYLLAQSPSLRQSVFDALVADTESTHDTRIVVACLTGAVSSDWAMAVQLVKPIRADRDIPPEGRARLRRKLRALEIMSTLGGWNKVEEALKTRKLAALGPSVTDLLLMAANSPERRFRRAIVSALATLADPRATDLLIRALNDDYTKVRRKAITGLVRIGEPAVAALTAAASSDQTRIRRYALLCLSHIAGSNAEVASRVKPTISGALSDSEEVVRRVAIRAMANLATQADLYLLEAFLREATPKNAMEATEVVEALGIEGVESLRKMAREERNPAAAYYVARQGDPFGAEILADQLSDDDTREVAVGLLRELRDPRSVPYVAAQVRAATDWEGSWLAQELGALGGDLAVQTLIETLTRDANLMRRGAVRGLDRARDPAAIPALIRALEDTDRKVRKLASEALGHYGETAIEPLREALSEPYTGSGRKRAILLELLKKLVQAAQDTAG